VLHPVAELPEARVRVRREVLPACRPAGILTQSVPSLLHAT
jgi:hypothetical protein